MEETLRATRSGRPSSHVPIQAERSTLYNHALPLGRDKTVRPQDRARSRPLNRETLSDRLAPPTVPQRTTNHPEHAIERARERDTVAESHFQSNLSHWTHWYVAVSHCHTVSYEVNAFLLQHALNRLNILLILAGNANVTLDLAVTVLKNFELKRDTIQTENDVPAR